MADRGQAGDLDAWVAETLPRALGYAVALLRDRTRAEDVVQDCYCRLLGKADVYDLPRDGIKLLLKAITNACINLQTRRQHVLSLDRPGRDGGDRPWEPADPAAAPPDEIVMTRELAQAIDAGLARLPATHRAALRLMSEGHSQQEIADLLELTTGNVRVLVHRARKALAEHLAPFVTEGRP